MEIETLNLKLKKEENNLIGTYYIYLKNENKLIGTLTYKGYHYNKKLGDISYMILEAYTNKGYGKEALFNIIELLNRNDILDFWITCDNKNEVSKYIINTYLNVESITEIQDAILYRCSTELKKINENIVKK